MEKINNQFCDILETASIYETPGQEEATAQETEQVVTRHSDAAE